MKQMRTVLALAALACCNAFQASIPKIRSGVQTSLTTSLRMSDDGSDDFEDELDRAMGVTKDKVEDAAGGPSPTTKNISFLQSLGAISGRGEFATAAQKEAAAKVVGELEGANPTEKPALDDVKMEGRWELVYSSTQLFRGSPFFLAGRAVCRTDEERDRYNWFCDMHRQALAISTIGPVRQIVSGAGRRIVSEFEVMAGAVPFLNDFTPFSYSGGWPVTITGAIVSSADWTPTITGDGWELFMDTVEIKGSNLPGVRQALDAGLKLQSRELGNFLEDNLDSYSNPRPVFRTTYLDDQFRISRDQDDNIMAYVKTSDDPTPTDYSGIESDLGFKKLLEGFNDAITKQYL